MKKNKKSMTNGFIISLVVGLITLIILGFFIIPKFITQAEYDLSLSSCSSFLENVNQNPSFFTSNGFSLELVKAISGFCPSKNVKINSKNIIPAVNLINSCWKESGKGFDFLPNGNTAENAGICISCGNIKSSDTIQNFNIKLYSKLKKKYPSLYGAAKINNENQIFLSKEIIPKTIFKDNYAIGVYYLIYKPSPSFFKKGNNAILGFISEFSSSNSFIGGNILANLINKKFLSSSNSIGGIFLSINEKQKNGMYKIKKLPSKCSEIIYPTKIY